MYKMNRRERERELGEEEGKDELGRSKCMVLGIAINLLARPSEENACMHGVNRLMCVYLSFDQVK